MFEVIQSLLIPGEDVLSDRMMFLCELAMLKEPDEPATKELLDNTLDVVVTFRDSREIKEEIKVQALPGDGQMRALVEEHPELREACAQLLWAREEARRTEEEAAQLASEFRSKLVAMWKSRATDEKE